MLTVSVAMTVAFLTFNLRNLQYLKNNFSSYLMLVPEKLLERDVKHRPCCLLRVTKTEIKIVLCSHPGTQIILSVTLIEGEIQCTSGI